MSRPKWNASTCVNHSSASSCLLHRLYSSVATGAVGGRSSAQWRGASDVFCRTEGACGCTWPLRYHAISVELRWRMQTPLRTDSNAETQRQRPLRVLHWALAFGGHSESFWQLIPGWLWPRWNIEKLAVDSLAGWRRWWRWGRWNGKDVGTEHSRAVQLASRSIGKMLANTWQAGRFAMV